MKLCPLNIRVEHQRNHLTHENRSFLSLNSIHKLGIQGLYASLRLCTDEGNVFIGSSLHCLLVEYGYDSSTFLCCHLIRMYAACGSLPRADQIFRKLQVPELFAWTAIISAHAKHGCGENALKLYYAMLLHSNVKPDEHAYVAALQACASTACAKHGKGIYLHIVENGSESNPFILNASINMYSRCGSIHDARTIFNMSEVFDVVTWNVMLEAFVEQGFYNDAFHTFFQMQVVGTNPDMITYISILKACSNLGTLEQAKMIHLLTIETGSKKDTFLGATIIDTYRKCGSLKDACEAFTRCKDQDVVIWRTIIGGYVAHGYTNKAFDFFSQMHQKGLEIGRITYMCMLKAVYNARDLRHGKVFHSGIIEDGLMTDVDIMNALLHFYVHCGSLENARKIFDGSQDHDVVAWTTIIGGYVDLRYFSEAIELFSQMLKDGVKLDKVVLTIILQVCNQWSGLELGRLIHQYVEENIFQFDFLMDSEFIGLYDQYGVQEDSKWILGNLFVRVWCSSITDESSLGSFETVNERGIANILHLCSNSGSLQNGLLVHNHLVQNSLPMTTDIIESLILMYAECGSLDDAYLIHETSHVDDVVVWSALIKGYEQHGKGNDALRVFNQMQQQGIEASQMILISIVKVCSTTILLKHGMMMQVHIQEVYSKGDQTLNNAVIEMYAKCGNIEAAKTMFDRSYVKDAMTWNALISAHANNSFLKEAVKLLEEMQRNILAPAISTLLCIIRACCTEKELYFGNLVHSFVCETGHDTNVHLVNSLIDMYMKCENLNDAECMFRRSRCRSQITWGLIIAAYVQGGNCQKALECFYKIQEKGMNADIITTLSTLKACSLMCAINKGMILHAFIILSGFESNLHIGNTLVDMYTKCGRMEDAYRIFTSLPLRNTATWNALMAGWMHDDRHTMFPQCLQNMQHDSEPDSVTLMCVLSRCSRMGIVGAGLHYFQRTLEQDRIRTTSEHYNCIIDLLGRAGYLWNADDLLHSLPFVPDYVGRMSLLGHCNLHGNKMLGSRCLDYVAADEGRNIVGNIQSCIIIL